MKYIKYFIPVWGIGYLIYNAESEQDVFVGVIAIWTQAFMFCGLLSLAIKWLS